MSRVSVPSKPLIEAAEFFNVLVTHTSAPGPSGTMAVTLRGDERDLATFFLDVLPLLYGKRPILSEWKDVRRYGENSYQWPWVVSDSEYWPEEEVY